MVEETHVDTDLSDKFHDPCADWGSLNIYIYITDLKATARGRGRDPKVSLSSIPISCAELVQSE